jgi:hypothetical protein
LVKEGTVKIYLWNFGFKYITEHRGRPKAATSLQWVLPRRREDLIIGDHVYFYNHPAYDVLIRGVGGVWRLENAILVDQRGGVDRFQGHGYSGAVTEDKMKNDMRRHFVKRVKTVRKLIDQLKSPSSRVRNRAQKELRRYRGVVKSGGEYRIKGTAFPKSHKIKVDEPLQVPPIEQFPGLYHPNPKKRKKLNWVLRPIESA